MSTPRRRAHHLRSSASPEGADGLSMRTRTSVHTPIVPTTAGAAAAPAAPMGIPAASFGGSCRVSPVTGISTKPLARFFMANTPRWSSSCASSRVWPKAWASGARRGCSRSIQTRSCTGWWNAEQLHAFSAYFLHELPIAQSQLDELSAVLSAVRDGDMNAAEAIERLSRSPHWVWTAIDPETSWLLSAQVGERTLAMAQAVLHHIAQLLAPGCVPLLLSDGDPNYLPAIVTHFAQFIAV